MITKQIGNLRDSIPIDEKYYLLSQLEIKNISSGNSILIGTEFQAVNKGLKKGDFALYVTSIIKTSRDREAVFHKEDSEYEITLAENIGDNIVNKKDHYQQSCRIGGTEFKRYYENLYINLWVKSGSTQASKGDLCYFKPNTSLIFWR